MKVVWRAAGVKSGCGRDKMHVHFFLFLSFRLFYVVMVQITQLVTEQFECSQTCIDNILFMNVLKVRTEILKGDAGKATLNS